LGGSRAALVAAEELGIPYAQVQTVVADTGSLGYNDMTDGSRGTFSSSMATISASRNAIVVMRERAARMCDMPPLAAIANAVSNTVGVRMAHIPMSPPHIVAALEAERAG
jgi:CO/xanthine dehydrogenase Mo-binding subunit